MRWGVGVSTPLWVSWDGAGLGWDDRGCDGGMSRDGGMGPHAHPGDDPSVSHGGRTLMLLPWLASTWSVVWGPCRTRWPSSRRCTRR